MTVALPPTAPTEGRHVVISLLILIALIVVVVLFVVPMLRRRGR